MLTSMSLFSGGGLVECGMRSLGIKPVVAVELNPEIAEVYRNNHGDHVLVGRTDQFDPTPYVGVDMLWASPPCQNHSIARSKTLAERDDADAGIDILRWTEVIRPKYVFIENVPGYVKHPVFLELRKGLCKQGYGLSWTTLDFADYGVPQNRKRVILRAMRSFIPLPLSEPTSRLGWYQAVEDLIPTCPESQLADWQIRRLPAKFFRTTLVEPDAAGERPPSTREANEPAYTMKTSGGGRVHRAVLVSGGSAGKNIPYAQAEEPAYTLKANELGKCPSRALMESRVVALTPRCIARLQTVPDNYILPDKKTLAGTIIGNGVPCEGVKRIVSATLGL